MTGIFATIINGFLLLTNFEESLLLTNFEESPIVYVPKDTFAQNFLTELN